MSPGTRVGVMTLLAGLALASCGDPGANVRSPQVAAQTPSSQRDCAAKWDDTRAGAREAGQPDGEARRQADLARANCEEISSSEYPPGAEKTPDSPPCLEEHQRRDAPPPRDSSQIAVYFSCRGNMGAQTLPVYMHERPIGTAERTVEALLEQALNEYLRGPSSEEQKRGYLTALGSSIPDGLAGVQVAAGEAIVDFSDQIESVGPLATTAGLAMLEELRTIVLQFSEIDRVILRIEGDCERYWRLVESDCEVVTR